ncbi:winged helix-turn-helix transcriptional regulator [Ruania alkalisoli]|uniref:Winged helix-turn-helix transcriptional regulator n=1 Tax=Ruania alkalisoli TaxID=2779775 RepID=A0A7M1SRM7_9MICO|nr:metalloregulator ArsR/SmtB family transcription factor [Ruania alkalisoli]QOR69432.1 winged helix-turn-helix transcriptional regulator [Ruania alkalisoli]
MDVFEALGAPHRRAIVELLGDGESTAGQIASHFSISRPAISQHLGVLVDAGVLHVRAAGRERRYSLRTESLAEVENWLESQRVRWACVLDRLSEAMDSGEGER